MKTSQQPVLCSQQVDPLARQPPTSTSCHMFLEPQCKPSPHSFSPVLDGQRPWSPEVWVQYVADDGPAHEE